MSADPLAALDNEYGAEWKVWRPGRYVADHRRLDVTLISDSVTELAGKLRSFSQLKNAELLAGLLGDDDARQQDVA